MFTLFFLGDDQAAGQIFNPGVALAQGLLTAAERFLRPFALSDVRVSANDMTGRVLAKDQRAPGKKPAHRAVFADHPVLDLEGGRSSFDIVPRGGHYGLSVFRMDVAAPVVQMIVNLIVTISEQRFQFGVNVHVIGLKIPIPHADAAGRGRQVVAPSLLVERVLHLFPMGNVANDEQQARLIM